MKKMRILIVVVVIIIIILIIALLNLLPMLKEQEEEKENLNYGDVLDINQENTYLCRYIISNCIKEYIQCNLENNTENLKAISTDKINKTKFDEIYYLKINDIYKIERMNDTTYFVESTIDNQNEYFIVNVDYITNSYNIIQAQEKEFTDAKNNKVDDKYKVSIEIESNDYNEIQAVMPSNYNLVNEYYDNYTKLAVNKPEIAFELLEKTAKSTEFDNDLNTYKEYVNNNEEKIQNSIVKSFDISKSDEVSTYTIENTYGQKYTIKEYNYGDFTIAPESTLEDVNEYLNMTYEEKINHNIEKIFKFIDNKQYSKVYDLLDTDFKNTKYSTISKFETYAKTQFFDYNVLGKIDIQESGKNYVVTVNYKDGISSAAEKKSTVIIMRLLENTDFSIAFQVN